MGRDGERWGEMGRCGERRPCHGEDMGRYGEIWGAASSCHGEEDMGRYGEIWGDVGRCVVPATARRAALRPTDTQLCHCVSVCSAPPGV